MLSGNFSGRVMGVSVLLPVLASVLASASVPALVSAESKLQPLTVGYPRLRLNLAQFVAKEERLFEKHGLDVEMKPFETAQPMMLAQIAGRLDVAGYCALSISIPAAQTADGPILFGTMIVEDQRHPFSFLIAGAGTQIASIADLRGKTVGILPTVAFREMLKAILRENAVPLESVAIRNVNVPIQPTALASGTVQALFTPDPAATTVLSKGLGRILEQDAPSPTAKYLLDPYPFGAASVTKAFYEKHPDLVHRYFAALDEAIDFIREHPHEAKESMKPYIGELMRPFVEHYYPTRYFKTAEVPEGLFQEAAEEYLRWGLLREPFVMEPHLYKGTSQ